MTRKMTRKMKHAKAVFNQVYAGRKFNFVISMIPPATEKALSGVELGDLAIAMWDMWGMARKDLLIEQYTTKEAE